MVDAAKATADGAGETVIIDHTEINTVQLRRTIYLTIQSSVDFEECVHKLLKLQIPEKMWKGSSIQFFFGFYKVVRNVPHDRRLLWPKPNVRKVFWFDGNALVYAEARIYGAFRVDFRRAVWDHSPARDQ